jgi:hypothetical protein
MEFLPHGEINLSWRDNCLVVKVFGPINEEGARVFNRKIAQQIVDKASTPWYRLECMQNKDSDGSPEVYQLLNQSLLWSAANQCLGLLLVGATPLNQELFAKANLGTGLSFYCYPTIEEALDFCRADWQAKHLNKPDF